MLIEKVFFEAEATLKNYIVEDAIIGAKVAAVCLNNGEIGTSFVLSEELFQEDGPAIFSEMAKGENAVDVAKWALDRSEHILKRTLGMATINACAFSQQISNEDIAASMAVEVNGDDTVGFIGYVRPVVEDVKDRVKKVIVFDNREKEEVYPPEKQGELLPTCNVVYITGSTFVNHTIDSLLELCSRAREVVLVGPTTPLFPKAYEGTNVRMLSGGIWKKEKKAEIFTTISGDAGVPKLTPFLHKKSIKVNHSL